MFKLNSRFRKIMGLALMVVIGVAVWFAWRKFAGPAGKPVFDGDSRDLQTTKVVATLDAPITNGTNIVWCASFLSAWKSLETDLVKGKPSLQGSPETVSALNKADDPRPHIPASCLFVAAGWNQKGITGQIEKKLAKKFPAKSPPVFPGIAPTSFVAYAYLEARVKFAVPYFQNHHPLEFTDSSGSRTKLSSFGIRRKDEYAYGKLRQQPSVLFESRDESHRLAECVIDLDHNSQPSQIILALVEHKATLAETLAAVEEKIARRSGLGHHDLGPNDVLLAPDMMWRISHRFAELEGRMFMNPTMTGQRMDVAQQDIQFCLDRSGAELSSESKTYMLPISTEYVFSRPFFIYMKKRDAEVPYFVMWIENAALLKKW